jgi:hypothetical protein
MESSRILSVLNLAIGIVVGIVVVVLIEEGIHYLIRRAAKAAGTSSTVIRDIGVAMRVIAVLVILAGYSHLLVLHRSSRPLLYMESVLLPFRLLYRIQSPTLSQVFFFSTTE